MKLQTNVKAGQGVAAIALDSAIDISWYRL